MINPFKTTKALMNNLAQLLLVLIFLLTGGVIIALISPDYTESTINNFICSIPLFEGFFELIVKGVQQTAESELLFNETFFEKVIEIFEENIYEGFCIASCIYILSCLQKMFPAYTAHTYPILGYFFGTLLGSAIVFITHGMWLIEDEKYNEKAMALMNETETIYAIQNTNTTPLCFVTCIALIIIALIVGYIYRKKNNIFLSGVATTSHFKMLLIESFLISLEIGSAALLLTFWLPTISIPFMVAIDVPLRIKIFIVMFVLSILSLILVHYITEFVNSIKNMYKL